MKLAEPKNPNLDFKSSDGALVKQCYAKLKELELSQSKAANHIDIGRSVLSQWLTDKYPGDVADVERKVRNWLSNLEARQRIQCTLPQTPGYFPTPSSRKVIAALSYAQMAADLAVIYGGAGVSKTTSIREYQAHNPNVWVLEATPCTTSMGSFLRALCQTVNVRVINCNNYELEADLIKRMRDSNGLLIVDEAQFLNEKSLETARRLAELAGVGLALAGNELIYSQLTGNNRHSAAFAQLFSRIGKRVRLTRPSKEDIAALCAAWNIQDKAERDLITAIALKPGALRMATKTLRMASMMANANGDSINCSHIRAAWNDLGGE